MELNALKIRFILAAILLCNPLSLHAANFKIKPWVLTGDLAPSGETIFAVGGFALNGKGDMAFIAHTVSGQQLNIATQSGISTILREGVFPISTRLPDPTSLGIAPIPCPHGSRICALPEFQAMDFFQLPDGHQVSCAKEIRLPDGPRDVNDTRDIVMALTLLSGGSVSFLGCPLADYLWHVIYNHNGSMPFVGSFGLNNLGTVALFSTNFVDTKIVLANDGGLNIVSLIGAPAPTGGTIQSIANPVMNENEALLVPFLSSSNVFGPQGLLLFSKDQTTPVAFTGSPAPGGRSFVLFPAARLEKRAMLNNREQIAFAATLDNGSSGIFRWDPDGATGATTALVQEPSSAGLQTLTLSINDRGDVAAWILKGFFNPRQEILVIDSNGRVSKVVGLNDPAPGGGTFAGVFSPTINNKGEIVFFGFLSNGKHGIFLASSGLETEFVDPIPDLLVGSTIPFDPPKLATDGRKVTGIAADGAAQVVVRVKTGQTGNVEFSLVDEGGAALPASNMNGFLGQVGSPPVSSAVSVQAQDVTGVGPMAFAAFRAPVDFSSGPDSVEAGLPDRQVFIKVKLTTSTGETVESTESIKIVRPPVVLVHGLWGSRDSWDGFEPLISDSRFSNDKFLNERIDYSGTNALSIALNAPFIGARLRNLIKDYKVDNGVAAIQADAVTHSMGGLLARMLSLSADGLTRDDNFQLGDIHKLINIATPHFGSELARLLTNDSCVNFFFSLSGNRTDQGAVEDLVPRSPVLNLINGLFSPLLLHNVTGIANQREIEASDDAFWFRVLRFLCRRSNLRGGLDAIHHNQLHDLVVDAPSQQGSVSSTSLVVNVIHTTVSGVFVGEEELKSRVVSDRIIRLLNLPLGEPTFTKFSPIFAP